MHPGTSALIASSLRAAAPRHAPLPSRPPQAIDVCAAVLKQFPDYPMLKTEVLARARAMLRP